jgi:predicted HTH transcriptional regulator
MKSNNSILTEKEIQERTKFWNKKQFRTWSEKELERTSKDMQNLLAAIKEFSMDEIKAIRKLDMNGFDSYYKKGPKYIIRMADQRDLDYAISIAPKTFKVKQG